MLMLCSSISYNCALIMPDVGQVPRVYHSVYHVWPVDTAMRLGPCMPNMHYVFAHRIIHYNINILQFCLSNFKTHFLYYNE